MASVSELLEYARAKQPKNKLADIAAHFIAGADAGYNAGQKAKDERYDQILKSAQALKAQEEARSLKSQNDLWDSFMTDAKMQGKVPLTAGEMNNGKTVMQNELGDKGAPVSSLAKMAALFTPPDGMKPSSMSIKLPGKMGGVSFSTPGGTKTKTYKPTNPLGQEKEDRIVWEQATRRALDMYQQENPLGTMNDPGFKKYLPTAFESLGKDPKKYIKDTPLTPPVNNDPWGLLTNAATAQ